MEKLVKDTFTCYTIIRIGNIAFGKNPNTFINAYKAKPYIPKDEYRYIVDKEEFLFWVDLIPEWNCEINIPGQRMTVKAALKKYAK